ncbi:3-dehydroquinate synthase [Lachnospiraceae bacterium ZAX-1]
MEKELSLAKGSSVEEGLSLGKELLIHYDHSPCYQIILQPDFSLLPQKLESLGYGQESKICIITDSNVVNLYGAEIESLLKPYFKLCTTFVFKAGEENKQTDTVGTAYKHLIEHAFDRKDLLLALGGGVVGDLTGFTAATYLRGIDFIQVPTTLLAQVDSSIGGKTGVDFLQYKNMVGAFYMPRLVYMNIAALNTLSGKQFSSGMSEIIKHGLIKDFAYFLFIEQHFDKILKQNFDTMEELVFRSCDIKREVVEQDPKEQGERALLNFGHTIGHAIEKLSNFSLSHGECVALGMVSAGYLSMVNGNIDKEEFLHLRMTIEHFGLPIRLKDFPYTAEEILNTTKLDKKMESGKIKFILLQKLGNAYITKNLSDEQILEGIQILLLHEL